MFSAFSRSRGTQRELAHGNDARKRVPAILQLVPTLNEGSVERGALEIGEAVLDAGGRALICTGGGRLEQRFRSMGGEVFPLPFDQRDPVALRRNARKLEHLINAEKVDLVHGLSPVPSWSALWASRAARRPFVTSYHAPYHEAPLFKRRFNSVMTKGNPVIAVSDFIADTIAARYDVGRDRIATVPRGVDLSLFTRSNVPMGRVSALIESWYLSEDHVPIFMLPGRLARWKGQEVFIDACAELYKQRGPAFLGLIVGDDSANHTYAKSLMQRIDRHKIGECVRLTGACTDMSAAYVLADCVVSASIKPEAFGHTAVEAQAMGRPVIASDHGGTRETIEEGVTGFRVLPKDSRALAAAMGKILDLGEAEREALSAACRERIERLYSSERMREATLDVYERVLGFAFPGRNSRENQIHATQTETL